MSIGFWLLTVAAVGAWGGADIRTLRVSHTVAASSAAAFDACLYGWRSGNFGLPIPLPIIRSRGAADSGEGLELIRVPPFLIERITISRRPAYLKYGVVNPGPLTYPVSRHSGMITFEELTPGEVTRITWDVEWTPLPWSAALVSLMTEVIVRAASHYTACRAANGAEPLSVQINLVTIPSKTGHGDALLGQAMKGKAKEQIRPGS